MQLRITVVLMAALCCGMANAQMGAAPAAAQVGAPMEPSKALDVMLSQLEHDVVPAAKLDQAVDTLCAAILKAPRPAIYGVKEYVKTAPDMAVFGAVEFARNLHATVNSSGEMRRKH